MRHISQKFYVFLSSWLHTNAKALCNLFWESEFFLLILLNCPQESLAFMFEMAQLHEDALREYDELELCYIESGMWSMNTLLILPHLIVKRDSLVYTDFSYNGVFLFFRWSAHMDLSYSVLLLYKFTIIKFVLHIWKFGCTAKF